MTAPLLSRSAKAVLVDIYVHTYRRWGALQADKYLDGLYDTFRRITRQEALWRPVPAAFGVSGYFTRYEKHYIYWRRFKSGEIGVTAILHASMMQGDRLKAAFVSPFEVE